jgi:hypothetical protein
MHPNGGYTKVLLEDVATTWDIPTLEIPVQLRSIGSRFLLVTTLLEPEPGDSDDEIRAACDLTYCFEPANDEGAT